MGTFNHYVIVKFKDGVAVDDLIQGLEKMVFGIDHVKSFEWYKTYISLLRFKIVLFFFPLTHTFLHLCYG